MSAELTPAAATRIKTSPAPGLGTGASEIKRTSRPRACWPSYAHGRTTAGRHFVSAVFAVPANARRPVRDVFGSCASSQMNAAIRDSHVLGGPYVRMTGPRPKVALTLRPTDWHLQPHDHFPLVRPDAPLLHVAGSRPPPTGATPHAGTA